MWVKHKIMLFITFGSTKIVQVIVPSYTQYLITPVPPKNSVKNEESDHENMSMGCFLFGA